jgi:GT2 family glycosyltransferase
MIYVAIPVFNRKHLLRACLQSLRRQTVKDFAIIITDDGSTDGTGEMLRTEFPEVTVLNGDGNLWWTGAINLAVGHALTLCGPDDYILVLNDDLEVPENYIENFYSLAKAHPKTLIGSVVTDINNRDRIHSGGVRINWLTGKVRGINDGKSLSSFGKGYYTDQVSYLTGRGVLIPAQVFRELGLYNNKHYRQCGDTELPRRAQKAGYKLIVSYDVPVFSHVKDEGHINHLNRYSLKLLRKYYFDVRSNMNLRYRFWFALDSTSNVIHGLWFFVMDFVRITVHFFRPRARA